MEKPENCICFTDEEIEVIIKGTVQKVDRKDLLGQVKKLVLRIFDGTYDVHVRYVRPKGD